MINSSWILRFLLSLAATMQGTASAADSIAVEFGEIRVGMSYGEARERLIDGGWEPDGSCHADEIGCDSAYPETENCAGTGVSPCRFRWKAGAYTSLPMGAQTITILTTGEIKKAVSAIEIK